MRSRIRELRGLLLILDVEISYNQRTLSMVQNNPQTFFVPVGEFMKKSEWERTRSRIAYLMAEKNHFRTFATFFINIEDVILPVVESPHVEPETKLEFVSKLLPDMLEKAAEARAVIRDYVELPEEAFGLPFNLEDNQ